jgi:hypothetical protein
MFVNLVLKFCLTTLKIRSSPTFTFGVLENKLESQVTTQKKFVRFFKMISSFGVNKTCLDFRCLIKFLDVLD